MTRRFTGLQAGAALLVVVFAMVLALGLVACGDKYIGTWKASFQGQEQKLTIEKSGDSYLVYDPATPDQKQEFAEKGGKLTGKDPNAGMDITFERKGDKLILSAGGINFEMTKE